MTNTITDIQPLPENPNFRVIFVNDIAEITVPLSTIEELEIETQQIWTAVLSNRIALFENIEVATSMALKLIALKSWGVKELAARLIERGVDSTTADLAATQLDDDGWLNDGAYACARIRDWIRIEPASRAWLRRKLQERQLSDNTIDAAIDEELGDRSEQDAASELAKIRLAKVTSHDEISIRRRVLAALGRRGFPSDVGAEAFRRAQIEDA